MGRLAGGTINANPELTVGESKTDRPLSLWFPYHAGDPRTGNGDILLDEYRAPMRAATSFSVPMRGFCL